MTLAFVFGFNPRDCSLRIAAHLISDGDVIQGGSTKAPGEVISIIPQRSIRLVGLFHRNSVNNKDEKIFLLLLFCKG